MRCHRCGGALVEVRETVPYVGPGPCVVELRDVRALRCTACGHVELDVPEPRRLDTLVRTLGSECLPYTPTLIFDDGRWRIVAAPPDPDHEAAIPAETQQ
jgi:YgiT-type zinc finger domain-containing protein